MNNKTPAIAIEHLNKTYASGTQAVKDVSFEVNQGEFFALLGPNGAGKTTTIGMISSLVNKTSGRIAIMGHDLDQAPGRAKSYLGVMPQEVNLNVFEKAINILYHQASYYGIPRRRSKQRAEMLLKAMELWPQRNDIVRSFSGGMKRRLMVARSLIHDPKVLILDEPTAGVDVEIRQQMWDFLQARNREGLTIVLTTHYLEEAENLCNDIAIINKGSLVTKTSMKDLLNTLECETIVLHLSQAWNNPIAIDGTINQRLIDSHTLEIDIAKQTDLTEIIEFLRKQQVSVNRIRNKVNRLEQLFMDIVQQNSQGEPA
ncbi:MAG: ABC transporter ATP-binding protein [Coxiellaceae bacterium]|nr:ABC transporter ATP-binding protein [Coxiellaceae bacterium]